MSQQKLFQAQNGHSMFPKKFRHLGIKIDWEEKYYLQCIGANGKAFTLQVYNCLYFSRLLGFLKITCDLMSDRSRSRNSGYGNYCIRNCAFVFKNNLEKKTVHILKTKKNKHWAESWFIWAQKLKVFTVPRIAAAILRLLRLRLRLRSDLKPQVFWQNPTK